jgi:alpha-beta hydrolase superfamily lysophospholipase
MSGFRPGLGRGPILALLAVLAGCVRAAPDYEPPPAADLDGRWSAYLATLGDTALQEDCVPVRRDPPPGATVRGAVLMLHGFNACPQQYEELAGLLAAEGFVALAPLLPGHGRMNPAVDRDDTRDLSTPGTWEADYGLFVRRMNAVMAAAQGERVIVGLSVGSATAIYALLDDRELYDRGLLFVPYLGMPGGAAATAVAGVVGRIPVLRETSVGSLGWRGICVPKRKAGRAGYCDYRFKHVVAINRLGAAARSGAAEAPLKLPLQIVPVNNDAAVSERRLREFISLGAVGDTSRVCVYPEAVPHSMLSRADHPGEDLFWLDAVFAATVDFVVNGRSFPLATDEPPLELGPQCRI